MCSNNNNCRVHCTPREAETLSERWWWRRKPNRIRRNFWEMWARSNNNQRTRNSNKIRVHKKCERERIQPNMQYTAEKNDIDSSFHEGARAHSLACSCSLSFSRSVSLSLSVGQCLPPPRIESRRFCMSDNLKIPRIQNPSNCDKLAVRKVSFNLFHILVFLLWLNSFFSHSFIDFTWWAITSPYSTQTRRTDARIWSGTSNLIHCLPV